MHLVLIEEGFNFQTRCAFRLQSEHDGFEALQHGGLFGRRLKLLHGLAERVLKLAVRTCQTLTHVCMTRHKSFPS